MNYIKFTDTVDFASIQIEDKADIRDFGNPLSQPTQPTNNSNSLIVKIAASHAGIITRNNGFYIPEKMATGVKTFTEHYAKPIQTHHNQESDPIGRVLKAEYVDTSATVKDYLGKKDTFKNKSGLLDAFLTGKLSYIQSVNFICDNLSQTKVLQDPSYQGMGYAQLIASISDPEAITKIKDGRYLTGSVGVSTDRAVCSVCKEDWTAGAGPCEHRPGRLYDGVKAFLITGNLTYNEYSFVNVPADRHSRVLEINTNGITDSYELDDPAEVSDSIANNNFISTIDSVQQSREDSMSEVAKLVETLKGKYSILDEKVLTELVKSVEVEPIEDYETRVEAAADKAAITQAFTLEVDSRLDALKLIRPMMDVELVTSVFNENKASADAFYTSLNEAEWNDYSESDDDILTKYKVEHPEDAKLSSSARKRLPGSTFCGPGRSFPVPDCAHVTAARRLIGRASVSPATKSRILGCVSRKAKSMGCGGGKDAVKPEDNKEEIKVDTKIPCKCEETQKTLDALTVELEAAKTALSTSNGQLDSLNKEKNKLSDELDSTRQELKLTHEDLTQMANQLVDSKESYTKLLVDRVIDYKLLSGEKVEDKTKTTDELLALGEDKITDSFKELSNKVDMNKIHENINSGLARNPTGTVEDPTGKQPTTNKMFDKQNIENVAAEYMRIKLGGNSAYGRGVLAAENYRKDMQNIGLLPVTGNSNSE